MQHDTTMLNSKLPMFLDAIVLIGVDFKFSWATIWYFDILKYPLLSCIGGAGGGTFEGYSGFRVLVTFEGYSGLQVLVTFEGYSVF